MKKRLVLLILIFCSFTLTGQKATISSEIEEKITHKIKSLKEIKRFEKKQIKNGCLLSSMIYQSDEKKGKYLVHVGQNTTDTFITYYLFEVDKKTLKIIRLNK